MTVEWPSESGGSFYFSGVQFRPITPRVTHIYDAGISEPVFMGAIEADNDTEFKLQLVELLNK